MATVSIDELPCVLNPVQIGDLAIILEMTQPARRPFVLIAFLGWDRKTWADHAGIDPVNVSRWLNGTCRCPVGGAMRLAKVVGQPSDMLFREWA